MSWIRQGEVFIDSALKAGSLKEIIIKINSIKNLKKKKNERKEKDLYLNVHSSLIQNNQKTRNNPNVYQLLNE